MNQKRLPGLFLSITLVSLFVASAVHGESDAAFTSYDRIVEVAFPSSKLALSNHRPSGFEADVIEMGRKEIFRMIEASRASWFGNVVAPGSSGSADEWWKAKQALLETPIWICDNGCKKCGSEGDRRLSCVNSKSVGQFTASIIFLDPCLLMPLGCSRSGMSLLRALEKQLTVAAIYALQGEMETRRIEKIAARASSVLSASLEEMDLLASACPGPFSARGEDFLRRSGHLSSLNEFIQGCAKSYVSVFRGRKFSSSCQFLIDRGKLDKIVPPSIFTQGLDASRCDGVCESLTCAPRNANGTPVPRVLQFGRHSVVSIPEDTCDGAVPSRLTDFVRETVRQAAKPEVIRKASSTAMLDLCVRSLVTTTSSNPETGKKDQ